MQTWVIESRRPPGVGEWNDEPDKAQWVDDVTGLDCLAVRAHHGAWCGYVGVPPGHPWHGKPSSALEHFVDIYDGLSYGALGDEESGICHVPEPGRPADVWWIGFACMSSVDIQPIRDQRDGGYGFGGKTWYQYRIDEGATYKPLTFIIDEVSQLAAQVSAAA